MSLVACSAMVACSDADEVYVAPERKEVDVAFNGGTAAEADVDAGNIDVGFAPGATCGAPTDVGKQRICSTECGEGAERCVEIPDSVCNAAILVAGDEWPLSDVGFDKAPDAVTFVKNVARCFSRGKPSGRFLVRSDWFSLVGKRLADLMKSEGHTWEVNAAASWTLEELNKYDGVFLSHLPFPGPPELLQAYVDGGGHVYISGGVGFPDPAVEAGFWNPFLKKYGLAFEAGYDNSLTLTDLKSTHPLFLNVSTIYQGNGSPVILLPSPMDREGAKIVLPYPGKTSSGCFGVFDSPSRRWGWDMCSAPQLKGGICDKQPPPSGPR